MDYVLSEIKLYYLLLLLYYNGQPGERSQARQLTVDNASLRRLAQAGRHSEVLFIHVVGLITVHGKNCFVIIYLVVVEVLKHAAYS